MAGERAGDRRGREPQHCSLRGLGDPYSLLSGAEPATAAHCPASQGRAGLRGIGKALSPRGISHTTRSRLETELGLRLAPTGNEKVGIQSYPVPETHVRSRLLEGVWALALETTELSSTPDFAA